MTRRYTLYDELMASYGPVGTGLILSVMLVSIAVVGLTCVALSMVAGSLPVVGNVPLWARFMVISFVVSVAIATIPEYAANRRSN